MYIFRTDQEKTLDFSLSFENVEPNELEGYLRIVLENVEYSFKGKFIENGKFSITIPPLDSVVKAVIQNGEYSTRLEMITPDSTIFKIWEDNIVLKTKRSVKVENIEEVANAAPSIKGMDSASHNVPLKQNTKDNMFDNKNKVQDIKDMKRIGSMNSGSQAKAEKDLQKAIDNKVKENEEIVLPSWY